jgi:hypothetical protein
MKSTLTESREKFTQKLEPLNIKRSIKNHEERNHTQGLIHNICHIFAELTTTYEGRDKLTKGL